MIRSDESEVSISVEAASEVDSVVAGADVSGLVSRMEAFGRSEEVETSRMIRSSTELVLSVRDMTEDCAGCSVSQEASALSASLSWVEVVGRSSWELVESMVSWLVVLSTSRFSRCFSSSWVSLFCD